MHFAKLLINKHDDDDDDAYKCTQILLDANKLK